ncbi:MAG: hypothetical protein M3400_02175 [Actinomycetota bacterium]|nr:hypothetical protein [Actinomycetota bacterium]
MYVLVGMLLIGALLFVLWRMSGPSSPTRNPRGSARPGPPPARKPSRPQPLGPDDNPDFLRELDRRTKREEEPT